MGGETTERKKERELLITGHEDGSVRFWDSTGTCLTLIATFSSSVLFSSDEMTGDHPRDDDDDEWPPFRKVMYQAAFYILMFSIFMPIWKLYTLNQIRAHIRIPRQLKLLLSGMSSFRLGPLTPTPTTRGWRSRRLHFAQSRVC